MERAPKDIRVGLVLYGGVSLAVYMNGIVREVWELLRASRAKMDPTFAAAAGLGPTAQEWISVLEEIEQKTGCPPLRVVVDAIAGTSAGGINGVALGKAILEGADITPLTATWINQADLRVLTVKPPHGVWWIFRQAINGMLWKMTDKESRKTLDHYLTLGGLDRDWLYGTLYSALVSKDGRYTPLNGDTFTQLIADALDAMDAKTTAPLIPADSDLDVFVTRTDLFGWPRPLPLTSVNQKDQLFERTHAHMAHFKGRPSEAAKLDNFDLTYCARTTASFPVAFPLETHETIAAAWRKEPGRILTKDWVTRFPRAILREHALSGSPVDRAWMADGGIENNHPFTDLIHAIERKPVARDVHRAILYLEPDPEDMNPAHWGTPERWTGKPDGSPFPPAGGPPLVKTMMKLIGMISDDPIYEDLRHLKERDVTVVRLREDRNWIAKVATERVKCWRVDLPSPLSLEDFSRHLDRAAESAMVDVGEVPPDAVVYARVKVRSILDDLGILLARVLAYPAASRHGQFLALLLKSWVADNLPRIREGITTEAIREASQGQDLPDDPRSFLSTFDLAYRARRVRAVIQVVDDAYDTVGLMEADRIAIDRAKAELADALDELNEPWLNRPLVTSLLEPKETFRSLGDEISEILGAGDQDTLDKFLESTLGFDVKKALEDHGAGLKDVWRLLARLHTAATKGHKTRLYKALLLLPESHGIRDSGIDAALAFAFVDRSLFPRMNTAGITDLVTAEVMRLSPRDSTAISDNPNRIKGAELGAFAGFLSHEYREQDVLWGRADGMERLLQLVLRAAGRDVTQKGTQERAREEAWIKRLLTRLLRKAAQEHRAQGWTVPMEIQSWLADRHGD
ncbi:MAG: patatin-like protein [Rhodospirillum sp.]|nr:patatin-like protein [Rhodospirillum sp.]MCF8490282.1 patatin-like protein [Rhodospirillum sp.]MCF8499347.1 patatin-like protein [Rhodospirillum sp.]